MNVNPTHRLDHVLFMCVIDQFEVQSVQHLALDLARKACIEKFISVHIEHKLFHFICSFSTIFGFLVYSFFFYFLFSFHSFLWYLSFSYNCQYCYIICTFSWNYSIKWMRTWESKWMDTKRRKTQESNNGPLSKLVTKVNR